MTSGEAAMVDFRDAADAAISDLLLPLPDR